MVPRVSTLMSLQAKSLRASPQPLGPKPINMLSGDEFAERQLFDGEVAGQSSYQYDGTNGGIAWKQRVRRYFISKVPAVVEIPNWAGEHDQQTVNVDNFDAVVSHCID